MGRCVGGVHHFWGLVGCQAMAYPGLRPNSHPKVSTPHRETSSPGKAGRAWGLMTECGCGTAMHCGCGAGSSLGWATRQQWLDFSLCSLGLAAGRTTEQAINDAAKEAIEFLTLPEPEGLGVRQDQVHGVWEARPACAGGLCR